MIERFDEAPCVTSSVDTIKPHQMNILHELVGSMNPTPFLKTMEEGVSFIDALLREISHLDEELSSQKESMNISPSMDDQDLRSLVDDDANSVIEEEEGKA